MVSKCHRTILFQKNLQFFWFLLSFVYLCPVVHAVYSVVEWVVGYGV